MRPVVVIAIIALTPIRGAAQLAAVDGEQPGPTVTISGRAVGGSGTPLPNVQMTLSGGLSQVAYTNSEGFVALPGLFKGGSYTITPSSPGLAFTPPSFAVDSIASNVHVTFVNRQFGVTIEHNGANSTQWNFIATYPKLSGASYGFYHLAISDPADPNSPAGAHCWVAGFVNGYAEPGIERSFFVLNPPTDGAIGVVPQLSADVQDNRACSLDAKTSQIAVSSDGQTITMRVAIVFKPWFTWSAKGVYTQWGECCWTGGPWTRHTVYSFPYTLSSVAPASGAGGRRTFFLSFPYSASEGGRFYELAIGDPANRAAGICNALIAPWVHGSFLIDVSGQWRPQTVFGDPSYAGQSNGLWYWGPQSQVFPAQNSSELNCRMTVNPSPSPPSSIHMVGDYYDPNTAGQHYQRYETTTSSPPNVTTNLRVLVEVLPGGAFAGPKPIYVRTWGNSGAGAWEWRGTWTVQ